MSRQDTFNSLFHEHGDMIFRYCAIHTYNLQDAQDIYQEVFLKLYKKQPTFHDDMHAKAWLLKVSVNLCKNYHRARILHPTIEYDDSLHVPFHEETIEPGIVTKLRKLPHKFSSVLYLYYFEGYPLKDISTLLNHNESTVRSWMARGKKQLRHIVEEDEHEDIISRIKHVET